jgi:hypothetical protein
VRFEVRGEPTVVGICHCLECRKATGSTYSSYARWPLSAFRVTGDSRAFKGRSFCPICGSRLFNLNPSRNDVGIMIGALDEAPSGLHPACEGWVKRRERWLAPIDGASQFDQDPT